LYLAHRIPFPPDKGEKTRCFHELQFLSARHSIDLFCFADSPREAEGQKALNEFCRRVHVEILRPKKGYLRAASRMLSGLPASVSYYDSKTMHQEVRQAIQSTRYDLIFVYCSSMAQFVPLPLTNPTVVDFVDADSAKWAQYAAHSSFPLSKLYAREAASLARYEKHIAETFHLSLVTTPQEVLDLGAGGCQRVEVVANGVAIADVAGEHRSSPETEALQPYALFVGTMSYRPNADAVQHFAEDILPLIRETNPELRFLIVGREPSAAVQKLASLPNVVVTGTVPDVHSYLEGASVVVAPFRIAQGVQNKILEALVAGVPVVSTSRPARAVGEAAKFVSVADSPMEFAKAVKAALDNPAIQRRSREAAPQLRRLLAWQPNLEHMERLLEQVAAGGRASAFAPGHAEVVPALSGTAGS
jgi:sugar transferase (PEP-CTERM/EpsH1 system associated)